MSRTRFASVLMAIMVVTVEMAAAQTPGGPGRRGALPRPPIGFPPGGPVGLFAIEPVEAGRPVLGIPFTADGVTEADQLLPDGTRTKRRTSVEIARDSRGRIRREHRSVLLGPLVAERSVPLVTISDPTAGTQLLLDAERGIAVRTQIPAFDPRQPGDADGPARLRNSRPPSARSTPLGFRNIDGVMAEGTRTTLSIEGRNGASSPINVVSERWYSHELQAVVMTERFDPRFGQTNYRLTNIGYAEPSPDLFEVPAGFTIQDRPGRSGLPRRRR